MIISSLVSQRTFNPKSIIADKSHELDANTIDKGYLFTFTRTYHFMARIIKKDI